METVLITRPDNDGDVLLAGPAIRAVAASARVVLLVSPSGEQAAWMLPGVNDVFVWPCPWSGFDPPPVDRTTTAALIDALRLERIARALILTSFHQSPLPMALLLRLAGVRYDRGRVRGLPRVVAGRAAPAESLVTRWSGRCPWPPRPVTSCRPGTTAGSRSARHCRSFHCRRPLSSWFIPARRCPARAPDPLHTRAFVAALRAAGWQVLVTGSAAEKELTATVAAGGGQDLGGRTTYRELAAVLRAAACVVVGNTGPAHLAAAVGTPVVSLFAPVVPVDSWAPWGVPSVVLGDQQAACRDSRARICPEPGHPCLNGIAAEEVVVAVHKLVEEVAA